MKRIFKYPLEITESSSVSLPQRAIPLYAGEQSDGLQLWVLVDEDWCLFKQFDYHVYGTGDEIRAPNYWYLNTVLSNGGQLVWHVFVERP